MEACRAGAEEGPSPRSAGEALYDMLSAASDPSVGKVVVMRKKRVDVGWREFQSAVLDSARQPLTNLLRPVCA